MSYSLDTLKDIAADLILDHISSFEFLSIAEDEDLEDLSEEEQRQLFNLVLAADITAAWEPNE